LTDWDYWRDELLALDVKWFKLIDPGDGSALPAAENLLSIGIMPVVRFYEKERYPNLAKADREIKTARDYVSIGAPYFEINNEPDLNLEWKDRKRPPNWLDVVVDNFIVHASWIRDAGGFLLFPAFGPGGRANPFEMIVERGRRDLLDGNCCLAIHNYCLGRPLDYPNDPVTMHGKPITTTEWAYEASDKKIIMGKPSGPMWAWEMGPEAVNEWRLRLANPDADIMEDSTCFRAHEYFDALVNEAVGHSIPIFTTEGGYNVGQRAGTTFGDDPRWPKPSPSRVAQMTLEMFRCMEAGPDYYFACMPWLIANYSMGYGEPGFEHQGPWYSPIYKYEWNCCDGGENEDEMPVVEMLKKNPGKEKGSANMAMRRAGLWLVNGTPSPRDIEDMYSIIPGAVTCFHDHLGDNQVRQYKEQNPGAKVIIRFLHPVDWRHDPVYHAKRLGDHVASKWPEIAPLDPYVYFANEVNLHYENGDQNQGNQHLYQTPHFYQWYADWVRMTADHIKNIIPEMKLVTPPFAFGHDEDGVPVRGMPTIGWAGYDHLWQTVHEYFDDVLTFHAYWPRDGGGGEDLSRLYGSTESDWYAYRWRKLLELFAVRYGVEAKVIIDEAGNFDAGSSTFTQQVIDYTNECLRDPRVLAVTWFLYRDPTESPSNLPNSWTQRMPENRLKQHLEALRDQPPVLPDRTVRIEVEPGRVLTLPLEEYLRGVIPSEMPPSWPIEALKAQAVAARSYAVNAMTSSRHGDAHLCAGTHCQVWNPENKRLATDEAVGKTEGQVIKHDGMVANALYSANCGGRTLGNEEAFGSDPVPYLRPVECPVKGEKRGHGVGLCQEGARALAGAGLSHVEVLKHYYHGVEVADLDGVEPMPDPDPEPPPDPDPDPGPGPPPNGGGWKVELERGPGLALIVGDWPLGPGHELRFTSPSGRVDVKTSGEKLEFGPGGFESYAQETGDYTLEGGGLSFTIPMSGQFTRVVFEEGDGGGVEMVKLVSRPMTLQEAEAILVEIVDGIFEIVEA
jgi:hypothetical protein